MKNHTKKIDQRPNQIINNVSLSKARINKYFEFYGIKWKLPTSYPYIVAMIIRCLTNVQSLLCQLPFTHEISIKCNHPTISAT